MKKIRTLLLVAILVLACATTSLACTPRLAPPKLPKIPTITNVKLPEGVQKSIRDYVKNLNIKIQLN